MTQVRRTQHESIQLVSTDGLRAERLATSNPNPKSLEVMYSPRNKMSILIGKKYGYLTQSVQFDSVYSLNCLYSAGDRWGSKAAPVRLFLRRMNMYIYSTMQSYIFMSITVMTPLCIHAGWLSQLATSCFDGTRKVMRDRSMSVRFGTFTRHQARFIQFHSTFRVHTSPNYTSVPNPCMPLPQAQYRTIHGAPRVNNVATAPAGSVSEGDAVCAALSRWCVELFNYYRPNVPVETPALPTLPSQTVP